MIRKIVIVGKNYNIIRNLGFELVVMGQGVVDCTNSSVKAVPLVRVAFMNYIVQEGTSH